MVQITEAVYENGVLKPTEELHLREQEHVRIIVEPLEPRLDRQTAVARLKAGIAGMQFSLTGPLPKRDELHERP